MTTAASSDVRRARPDLYRAGSAPVLVDVPDLPFLRIDGAGDPNTSARYAEALRALYAVAYGVRFALKRGPAAVDAPVPPLEGLWWVPDMALFDVAEKSAWLWTLQLPQADAVTPDLVAGAAAAAGRKGVERAAEVRFERFAEGRCAQVLHRGPYADEGPTIAALTRSSPSGATASPAGITRSTSATHGGPRPNGSGRSSASRSPSADRGVRRP